LPFTSIGQMPRPQALLLAVPPALKGHWSGNDLVDSVADTLDRAKLRAVEPDTFCVTNTSRCCPQHCCLFLPVAASCPFCWPATHLE
jgi:hypothetical protein